MSLPAVNPPLLLTKRLSSFLQANRTPQIPTLLITSPTGKLLAHASPQPVSLLRTHATVAASLLAIHTSSSPALPSALPGAQTPPPERDQEEDDDDETGDEEDGVPHRDTLKPATITVQLTGGTVLIRRLKCGLLFVCVGPSTPPQNAPDLGTESLRPPQVENGDTTLLTSGNIPVSTSPSEADSLISAGAQTTASLESQGATAVVAMRRHAADLARWLDDKLGMLSVPDDGVGVE